MIKKIFSLLIMSSICGSLQSMQIDPKPRVPSLVSIAETALLRTINYSCRAHPEGALPVLDILNKAPRELQLPFCERALNIILLPENSRTKLFLRLLLTRMMHNDVLPEDINKSYPILLSEYSRKIYSEITLLQVAVLLEDLFLVERLLQKGADVERLFGLRETPLMIAAKNNNVLLIETLLKYGAVIDSTGPVSSMTPAQRLTPLLTACKYGAVEAIDTLIDKGACLSQTVIATTDYCGEKTVCALDLLCGHSTPAALLHCLDRYDFGNQYTQCSVFTTAVALRNSRVIHKLLLRRRAFLKKSSYVPIDFLYLLRGIIPGRQKGRDLFIIKRLLLSEYSRQNKYELQQYITAHEGE